MRADGRAGVLGHGSNPGSSVGALIIIGFRDMKLYKYYNRAPPKNGIGDYLGPKIIHTQTSIEPWFRGIDIGGVEAPMLQL